MAGAEQRRVNKYKRIEHTAPHNNKGQRILYSAYIYITCVYIYILYRLHICKTIWRSHVGRRGRRRIGV